MCGRYADFLTDQQLADAFALATKAGDERLRPPSYNVAPMQTVRVIRAREGERIMDLARWGLVPSWAKDPAIGSRMINARVETIDAKPSFRTAFAKRRCVVPASGYFEWHTAGGVKTPYFIHTDDASPLAFAGLLEAWRASPEEEWLITCSIVTTAAQGDMTQLHERQPVMMQAEAWQTWLDPDAHPEDLFAAAAAPGPAVTWHAVDQAVGNVRNNNPSLVEPVS